MAGRVAAKGLVYEAEPDAAMVNRGAVVGVIVFRDQRLAPIAGRPLRSLPGNKIIVVWRAPMPATTSRLRSPCSSQDSRDQRRARRRDA
jgi:hypothetical protein